MSWSNTILVLRRELSDQWRDRRTIFTIVVMPIVLYPLMGIALLQTAQFMRQEPARVLLVDAENLPHHPPILESGGQFSAQLAEEVDNNDLVVTSTRAEDFSLEQSTKDRIRLGVELETLQMAEIQSFLRTQKYDLLVWVAEPRVGEPDDKGLIYLFVNSTSERSAAASIQVKQILDHWKRVNLQRKLNHLNVPLAELESLSVNTVEISSIKRRKTALWAKLLPFVVLVWALTGAFYPAIDVCAGEKERGTLETLLSSPARRSDIVMGKLMTVTIFSMATAVLNLISMWFTGMLVLGQIAKSSGGAIPLDLGLPPLSAFPWLIAGLLPIAALFSALALALAAFARSSKEGQYYLIPMLMSLLPLMMLSMLPSAKLDLGTSLIPVTGMLLLLRNLMMCDYAAALQFFGPVLAITIVCCWLATRWAIYQFNNESVLFRSGEQFNVGSWLKNLVRDRGKLPTFGEALLCGVAVLVVSFFVRLSAAMPSSFGELSKQILITQVATIALPAILMAMFLTRGPRETLRLNLPRFGTIPACILMAIMLHPGFMFLGEIVMEVYPPSLGLEEIQMLLANILGSAPNIWLIITVVALIPAICEELAFRGFILSGLQSIRGKWTAIVLSALFFGIAHGVLQQSILASVVGVVLGIIAVQTKSLLPCILFHLVHNALPVLISYFPSHAIEGSYMGFVLEVSQSGSVQYTTAATIMMPLIGIAVLTWLWKSCDQATPEPVFHSTREPVAV